MPATPTTNDANAAGQIVEWSVKDLNAFSAEANTGYYRDLGRYAPYNLATSTQKLRDIATGLSFLGPSTLESWKFRNPGDPPPPGTKAEGIEVDFQGSRYSWQLVQWKWDPATKSYGRYQFGGPHLSAQAQEQLRFATVIVMVAPGQVVDQSGHVLLEQLGEGPATVFTGGKAVTGKWTKADRESRTRFYDESGQEIAFERGPVFIEVIGQQSKLTVKATTAELPELPAYEPPQPGGGPLAPDDSTSDEPEPSPPQRLRHGLRLRLRRALPRARPPPVPLAPQALRQPLRRRDRRALWDNRPRPPLRHPAPPPEPPASATTEPVADVPSATASPSPSADGVRSCERRRGLPGPWEPCRAGMAAARPRPHP